MIAMILGLRLEVSSILFLRMTTNSLLLMENQLQPPSSSENQSHMISGHGNSRDAARLLHGISFEAENPADLVKWRAITGLICINMHADSSIQPCELAIGMVLRAYNLFRCLVSLKKQM